MIILDVDADFFFGPVYYDDQPIDVETQVQLTTPKEVVDRYNIEFGTPLVFFKNHSEAYGFIQNFKLKDIKLIHLDAHRDYDYEQSEQVISPSKPQPSISTWLGDAVNKGWVESIDWVYFYNQGAFNKQETLPLFSLDAKKKVLLHKTSFLEHSWQGGIDMVFYTLSPGYLKENNLHCEFLYYIKK